MKQKILSLIIILMVGTQPLFPFYWEEDTRIILLFYFLLDQLQ